MTPTEAAAERPQERSEFDKWFIKDSGWYDGDEGLGLSEYHLAREAWDKATALAEAKQRLKPLVWVSRNGYPEGSVAPMYQAWTVFGMYEAHGKGRGYGGSQGSAYAVRPDGKQKDCDSIEQGKELCRQDYVSRVRALFE